jgi:adenylate kinase
VEIAVEDEEIVKRLSGRRVHPESGRIYHTVFNPPAVEGIDDVSGEPLIQRDDDKEETIRKRLQVYHQQTRPLVDFYKGLQRAGNAVKVEQLDGALSVDTVRGELTRLLSAM